jgi:hypothetical protein
MNKYTNMEQTLEKVIRENEARGLPNYIWTGIGSDGGRDWFHGWDKHPAIGSIIFWGDQCFTCDGFAREDEAFQYTEAEGYIKLWLDSIENQTLID